MRIALINEGTYPVVSGGVSTWCNQLVQGLQEHEFHLLTMVGGQRDSVWDLPPNVRSLTTVPMWDAAPNANPVSSFGQIHHVKAAMEQFWSAVLPPAPHHEPDLLGVELACRALAAERKAPLLTLLQQATTSRAVVSSFAKHPQARHLPELSLRDAAHASYLVDRMLATLDAHHQLPPVDVVHAASNGPCGLVGLARHWHDGTPLLLTEHGIYLRERYLGLDQSGLNSTTRYIVMAAVRATSQLVYRFAKMITPVSDFNARWERQLGAAPERILTIHNGVDTQRFPFIAGQPETPTVSFVGRIDPLKDLENLLMAFAIVHAALPHARLRLFGPVPKGNEWYKERLDQLIIDLHLSANVTFDGPTSSAVPAIEAGNVVALSSISEGLPFTVMEAMMCGRATVSTDVGGVLEVAGSSGQAGVVVPPKDPVAFGEALVELLVNDDRRRAVGQSARTRALRMFDLDDFYARYRWAYSTTAAHGMTWERPDSLSSVASGHSPLSSQSLCAQPGSPDDSAPRPRRRADYVLAGPSGGDCLEAT